MTRPHLVQAKENPEMVANAVSQSACACCLLGHFSVSVLVDDHLTSLSFVSFTAIVGEQVNNVVMIKY